MKTFIISVYKYTINITIDDEESKYYSYDCISINDLNYQNYNSELSHNIYYDKIVFKLNEILLENTEKIIIEDELNNDLSLMFEFYNDGNYIDKIPAKSFYKYKCYENNILTFGSKYRSSTFYKNKNIKNKYFDNKINKFLFML